MKKESKERKSGWVHEAKYWKSEVIMEIICEKKKKEEEKAGDENLWIPRDKTRNRERKEDEKKKNGNAKMFYWKEKSRKQEKEE